MDLHEKIRVLPTKPGVYLYKNAEGEVIYVGKANNLRSRVRSYLLEASQANAKTGSLMREAVDIDYIRKQPTGCSAGPGSPACSHSCSC